MYNLFTNLSFCCQEGSLPFGGREDGYAGPCRLSRSITRLNRKRVANSKEFFCTGDHMSDKLELDAEKTTQTARPIFWFIGFAGIMLLGAIVYGVI